MMAARFALACLLVLAVGVQGGSAGCCCCTGACLYAKSPPCPCPPPPPGQKPPKCELQKVMDTYLSKYSALVPTPGLNRSASTFHPAKTVAQSNGDATLVWEGTGSWTAGFYPGLLWQLANVTKSAPFRAGAIAATAGLAKEQYDTTTHDVGFIVFGSFGNGVELGNMDGAEYDTVLVNAAHSLCSRWSPTVGMIRSWGKKDDASKFEVIIDNLLNLELLFWAGKHTNNATLTDHATAHALKTGELWLRDDNSTAHLCVFNPETGVLATPCTGTPQGYSAKSTWSRGQAWGIYGWTLAHRYTGDPRFVGFAERAAQYYMANADPKTLVPLWDFQAPANESWPDTSAAAITASALFELSAATGKKAHYDNAVGILNGLVANFVVSPPSTSEAVFFGNKHDDLTVTGGTIIETEYYTFEAIRRLMAAV